ncbi:hypothetical protein BJ508DRAFT_335790 [Ascobolus immersus RN42]|uniref:Uncharacterized protein n=1 Tax=Ascobolus immersus RN42 TaxID=1160509 RepID=A0A3N4HI51_ASCIM|nr:hypothetical protein BJ508DRAFT_335790 [Ascobolus immersus RN42]
MGDSSLNETNFGESDFDNVNNVNNIVGVFTEFQDPTTAYQLAGEMLVQKDIELYALDAEAQDLHHEAEALDAEARAMRDRLEGLRGVNLELANEVSLLKASRQDWKEECEELIKEVVAWRTVAIQSREEERELRKIVEGLKKEVASLKTENDLVSVSESALQVEAGELERNVEGLQKQVTHERSLMVLGEWLESFPDKVIKALSGTGYEDFPWPENTDGKTSKNWATLKQVLTTELEQIVDSATKTLNHLSSDEVHEKLMPKPAHKVLFRALIELKIDYRCWFAFIGIKEIRNYTAHPPQFESSRGAWKRVLGEYIDNRASPFTPHRFHTNTFFSDLNRLKLMRPKKWFTKPKEGRVYVGEPVDWNATVEVEEDEAQS